MRLVCLIEGDFPSCACCPLCCVTESSRTPREFHRLDRFKHKQCSAQLVNIAQSWLKPEVVTRQLGGGRDAVNIFQRSSLFYPIVQMILPFVSFLSINSCACLICSHDMTFST